MGLNTVHQTFEAFFASKDPKRKRPASADDPLAKFYRPGSWFLTGQVTEYEDGRALPATVFVPSLPEAKEAARKGWIPVECAPDEVLALFVAFHGADLPAALVKQLAADGRAFPAKK